MATVLRVSEGIGMKRVLILCAALASCSAPVKSPDEAKAAALEYRKALQSHFAMCGTVVTVAIDNMQRVATGKMNAISAYEAMDQGRTTCEDERVKAMELQLPDGMPPASIAAYEAMGATCDLALQGHVETMDALLTVVDGKDSPSMIANATTKSQEIAKMAGFCRAKLDAAAIGAGAETKDL
jgi:hypothetical protein